jgi:hypothetical protein
MWMPRFQVHISEPPRVVDSRESPGGLGSFARGSSWIGDAADEVAAIAAGWLAWDDKYGAGNQPADALVRVAELST